MKKISRNIGKCGASARGRTGGFTLVELIIVIVILGILAAVALPLFGSYVGDTERAVVAADLAILRKSIALYRVEHDSIFPGARLQDGSGGLTTGPLERSKSLYTQLLLPSDKSGKISEVVNGDLYPLGPYLTPSLPVNPANGSAEATSIATTAPIDPNDITEQTGWVYNVLTGEIRANTREYFEL